MGKKVYLSPAAHLHDNSTQCPVKCGENVHCNEYMDNVEKRLRELGFEVKRGDKAKTGGQAMQSRVAEANKWGADLYYVAHTNAGGGRYSMTMCYPNAASKAKANIIHKYRKCVSSHKVKTRSDLYEINATKMVCLYDELIFHDNAEDCKWFHNGGMEKLAEETVQALCEICGVTYKAKEEAKPAPQPKEPKAGDKVVLNGGKLYYASTGERSVTRTGTYYVYDGQKINGRYRLTNRPERVGKKPVFLYVSGWAKL